MPCRIEHGIIKRKEFLWKNASYDAWFLIVVISGRFSCTMRGKTQIVSEGELCFFPPNVPFDRQVIEEVKMHYIRIEWNCTQEVLSEKGCHIAGRVELSDRNRLSASLRMLNAISGSCVSSYGEAALHFVRDIWMQVLTDHTGIFRETSLQTEDPAVNRAIEYMGEHLHTGISIGDVSAYCGLSHVQLTNRFDRAVGTSPIGYLTNIRIQKACKLL